MANIRCPIVGTDEWKKLEERYGEHGAYLAWFRHADEDGGYPDVEVAGRLLRGEAAPEISREILAQNATDPHEEIGKLYDTAVSRGNVNKAYHDFYPLSDADAGRIHAATGVNVAGYVHSVDEAGIRHILSRHGSEREGLQGQLPVTRQYLQLIPDVVNHPDLIEHVGENELGHPVIRYTKRINGTILYAEEVRTGRKKLMATSLVVRKASADNRAPHVSSSEEEAPRVNVRNAPGSSAVDHSTTSAAGVNPDDATTGRNPTGTRPKPDQNPTVGHEHTLRTPGGSTWPAHWHLREASSVEPSHLVDGTAMEANPAFTDREIQARDRNGIDTLAQVGRMQRAFDPEKIANPLSMDAAYGGPTVDEQGQVVAGNARAALLKWAYAQEHSHPLARSIADAYRGYLAQFAHHAGVDPAELGGMHQPMLTREVIGLSQADKRQLNKDADVRTNLGRSIPEQARVDAERLTPELLAKFVPNEHGDINTAANNDFVKGFMQGVHPNDLSDLIYQDRNQPRVNRLTTAGEQRIVAALFAKAYDADPDTARDLSQRVFARVDSDGKNVLNGLVAVAPRLARLQASVAQGAAHPGYNLAPQLLEASRAFLWARESGTPVGEILDPKELRLSGMPEFSLDQTGRRLLQFFDRNGRSGKRILDALNGYLDRVERLGNPQQTGGDLLGGAGRPDADALVQTAINEARPHLDKGSFARQLDDAFGARTTKEQRAAALLIMEARAGALGRTLSEFIHDQLGGVEIGSPASPDFAGNKGMVSFLEDGRAVIHALERPDISTVIHELGHVWARTLIGQDREIIGEWLGAAPGASWDRTQQEQFARATEFYFASGQAPTPGLRGLCEKFRQWMLHIYKAITEAAFGIPKMTSEVRAAFERMFGGKGEMPEPRAASDTPALQQLKSLVEEDQGALFQRGRKRDTSTLPFDYDAPLPAQQTVSPDVKSVRFEAGKRLTADQKRDILRQIGDTYKDAKLEKIDKYQDRYGDWVRGYPYAPEHFVTSHITGAKIRHYVTLPDGRIAHPTEIFPNITATEIDAEMQRRENEERSARKNLEAKESRIIDAEGLAPAERNQRVNDQYFRRGRREPSIFAHDANNRFVRVDASDPKDLQFFHERGFVDYDGKPLVSNGSGAPLYQSVLPDENAMRRAAIARVLRQDIETRPGVSLDDWRKLIHAQVKPTPEYAKTVLDPMIAQVYEQQVTQGNEKDPVVQGLADDYAGRLNLKHLPPEQDLKAVLIEQAQQLAGAMEKQARGVRSNKVTLETALNDLHLTYEDAQELMPGHAVNAETIVALRAMLVAAQTQANRLARAYLDAPTDANLQAAHEAEQKAAAMTVTVAGASSEAGRALQAHQIDVASGGYLYEGPRRAKALTAPPVTPPKEKRPRKAPTAPVPPMPTAPGPAGFEIPGLEPAAPIPPMPAARPPLQPPMPRPAGHPPVRPWTPDTPTRIPRDPAVLERLRKAFPGKTTLTQSAPLTDEQLTDLRTWGSGVYEEGFQDYNSWRAQMLADIPGVEDHLPALWAQAFAFGKRAPGSLPEVTEPDRTGFLPGTADAPAPGMADRIPTGSHASDQFNYSRNLLRHLEEQEQSAMAGRVPTGPHASDQFNYTRTLPETREQNPGMVERIAANLARSPLFRYMKPGVLPDIIRTAAAQQIESRGGGTDYGFGKKVPQAPNPTRGLVGELSAAQQKVLDLAINDALSRYRYEIEDWFAQHPFPGRGAQTAFNTAGMVESVADRARHILSQAFADKFTPDVMAKLASFDPEDSTSIYHFLHRITQGKMPSGQMLNTYFRANILSSVRTLTHIFADNLSFRLTGELRNLTRGAISPLTARVKLKDPLTGQRTPAGPHYTASGAAAGLAASFAPGTQWLALQRAAYIIKNGFTPEEAQDLHGFSDQVDEGKAGGVRELPGGSYNPLNYVFRSISALDTFQRTQLETGALVRQATDQARVEGHTGPALTQRIAELVADPTPAMLHVAHADGRASTFQDAPTGTLKEVHALDVAFPEHWWLFPGFQPLRVVVPVINTAFNMLRANFNFSPFALGRLASVGKRVRVIRGDTVEDGIIKGMSSTGKVLVNFDTTKGNQPTEVSPDKITSLRYEMADRVASMLVGMAIMTPFILLALKGNLTSDAPSNPAQRRVFYAQGKVPNAIKLGGHWIPYSRFMGAFSMQISAVAAWFSPEQREKPLPDRLWGTGVQFAKGLYDQTFLQGLANMNKALTDERYATRWGAGVTEGFIPFSGQLKTVRSLTDPFQRQPDTFAEHIRADLPGLSRTVPKQIDAFGRPSLTAGSRGMQVWNALTGVNITKAGSGADPVINELIRLQALPGPTATKFRYLGAPVTLQGKERERYQVGVGQYLYAALQQEMADPSYRLMTDDEKYVDLHNLITSARKYAKDAYMGGGQ